MIGKAFLAGTAMLLAATAPLAAQETVGTPPPAPAGWSAPKTEWGDPDLRGTYPLDQVGRTPMQRRPQYGDRLLMTEEEYKELFRAASENFVFLVSFSFMGVAWGLF